MKKYEIKTDSFQFRFGTSRSSIPAMDAGEVFDAYLQGSANEPDRETSFDTLAEAQEVFKRDYASYGSTYAEKSNVFWILRGDVAWIEENDYDENGEFDQGGTVADFSAEGYEPEEE